MTDSHEAGGAELRPLVATLDGPASLAFRRPSTRPEVFASHGVSHLEPIGTRHLLVTASTFDGSESMVLVDRPDSPVWPDAPDETAACSADVGAGCAATPEGGPSEPADSKRAHSRYQACAQCGRQLRQGDRADKRYCGGACRVAAHRGRRATAAQYPAEEGRR